MKEGPRKRDILSRPASKKAAARPRSAPRNEPKPVPLPEGVRHQRVGETTERSAHLEKLKQLFEAAPISRYLGMNGTARVGGGHRGVTEIVRSLESTMKRVAASFAPQRGGSR